MNPDYGIPPVAGDTQLDIPNMSMNWLPPSRVYATSQMYPQVQLAPTNSGFDNLKVRSAFRVDSDSRRNFAGLKRLTGMQSLGDLQQMPEGAALFFGTLSLISMGLSTYHGYKRHRGSIPWAIGWGILGGLFPIVTPAVAFAEGFAKPMKGR